MGGCINGCLSRNYVSSNCFTASKTAILVELFIFRHVEQIKCANKEFKMVKGIFFYL